VKEKGIYAFKKIWRRKSSGKDSLNRNGTAKEKAKRYKYQKEYKQLSMQEGKRTRNDKSSDRKQT
jgi:hypothetical protein